VAEIINTSINVDINTSGAAAELRKLQQQINAFNLTLNKSQKVQGQAAKVWSENLLTAVNRTGIFRAEVVKMQTSAAALDATLRKGQATLGQFFSAAFNKRSAMAAETFALAAERARTMQTQFIATGKSARGMQDALAIRPLTAFSSELSIASQRTQILASMFRQGTTQLINFGKNVQWAGRQLMVGFTVPLTIFGSTAGRVFRDLEMQAVAFKKVYGDIFTTPAEIQGNLEAVTALGKEYTKYGIAVKDTVGLAAQAAAAGRRGADLTDAVRETTRLATLGQMDQNSALETTIALQSAFRLSGQQLSDTINFLNMVENQTVVSLQDIASAIPRVAPVIQGLGGDVKDLTVFLAAMQEGGVSAEQGANALKSGLGSLINPSKEATKQLGDFGINIKAIVQQNQGDLMGIVTTFSQALSTLGEFQQQQVLETLFGKYQYARLGALFENIIRDGSQAQQVISTMGYSTEQLRQTAEKELSTVEQAFSVQLVAAIERLKLAIAPIGELFTKMAIPVVNFLTRMVEAFNKLPDGTKNFLALATVITGLLIPAATMMFGLFANLIGTLSKMGQSISLFGITLLKRGPIAAVQTLTQSANYLSLSEIDAANAARQLGSATSIANEALLQQVGSASNATTAINQLTAAYQRLIAEQLAASRTQGPLFGPGGAASNISRRGFRRNKGGIIPGFATGNIVPGTGNTDTVPAMLTPGEFVVNKEATKNNLGLLKSINAQKLNEGGVAGATALGSTFVGGKLLYSGVRKLTDAQNKNNAELLAELLKKESSQVKYADFIKELIDKHHIQFRGQNKVLEKKVVYEQLEKIFNTYTENGTDIAKIDELTKEVVQQASRNRKDKNGFKSDHAKSIVKKLRLGNEDSFFRGIGKTHAAHTTSPTITTASSLFDTEFSKTGVPFQELGSRVIALEASLNNKLSGKGVDGKVLLDDINSKQYKIFDYMDAQFEKYIQLNQKQIDVEKVRTDYANAKRRVYSSLTTSLENNLDTKITDSPGPNSLSFESIFDNAMKNFDTPELSEFHDEIKKLTYIRAPRLKDLKDFVSNNPAMKAYLFANKITGSQINSMKGPDIWDLIFKANSLNQAEIDKISSTLFTIGPDKTRRLSNPTFTKTFSNLGYKTTFVEKFVEAIVEARGIKGIKANKGRLVPGTGNTDTVPAMLTPGEFVVNKEATKNNMGLLNAINAQKLNKGGKVKGGILYAVTGTPGGVTAGSPLTFGATPQNMVTSQAAFVTPQTGGRFKAMAPSLLGGAAQMALFGPLMNAGSQLAGTMGGLALSFVGTTAVSGLLQMALKKMMGTPVKLAEQFSLTSKVLGKVGINLGKIGLVSGSWITGLTLAGIVTFKVVKTLNDIRNSGSELTKAMYGGVDSVNKMAAAFGRETPSQRLLALKAQSAGGAVSQQAQQQASQFAGTDAGKQLIKDIETAKRNGKDAAEVLKNQLARNILAGVITPEEARGVAIEIGKALNDEKLSVTAVGRLTKLIGPNGEEIKDNRLKLIAEISPTTDADTLLIRSRERYEESTQGFTGGIVRFFDNANKEILQGAQKELSTNLINDALVLKENLAALEAQLYDGEISLEDYNKQIKEINKNAKEFNAKSLIDFVKLTGSTDLKEFQNVLKETTTVDLGYGRVGEQSTDRALKAQQLVADQVKQMQDAYFAQFPTMSEKQKEAMVSGMTNAFGGPESLDILIQWSKVLSNQTSSAILQGIINGVSYEDRALARIRAMERRKGNNPPPGTLPNIDTDLDQDPLENIKNQIKETDALVVSTQKLINAGLRPEIAATLNAAEAKGILADKSGNLIRKLNEEADKAKVLSNIYKDPKKAAVDLYNTQIEFINRGIDALNRQISVIQRKNELDQRDVEVRQRALEQLSKKEEEVNKVYSARTEALDKVAQINDRIAQQQQDRIALAGALTSGDFAAAASAAAGMTQNFAQTQIEDARSALELQRKQEIEALTVSVNNQMLTRQQIETQIDEIEERMYQRDLQIRNLQDEIYIKEESKYLLQQEMQTLNDQIALTEAGRTLEMGKQLGVAENIRKKLKAQYDIARAIALGLWNTKFENVNTGGEIAKKAFGGVMYRGSKEAPPALRMATGSIVPGMGITDKVPALLTPGEFVVRKSVAQANMPLL